MPQVIAANNGRPETILSLKDFKDLEEVLEVHGY